MRMRKGDLWKAAILIVAIAGVGWFIVNTILSARGGGSKLSRIGRGQLGLRSTDQKEAQAEKPEVMFARRPRTPGPDISRALAAADPFRPYVSVQPIPTASPEPEEEPKPQPPAAPELAELRLVGVISDSRQPMAVLNDGKQRYYLRRGDAVRGGWHVSTISAGSVTLVKGSERASIALSSRTAR
jgi:hypothetical protein